MKEESIGSLNLSEGQVVVDCTVNRAGHAVEIAKMIGKTGTLVIFDLDLQALNFSREKLQSLQNGPKIIAIHSNYRNIKSELDKIGVKKIDRIFADLGLSLQELDESGRGFTFQKDEPLYMTFQSEINDSTFTAKDLLNNLDAKSLQNIFLNYGEDKNSYKIATAIVDSRVKNGEISTTGELVKIIESVVKRSGKTHPATKIFQAIRIAVNDEYGGITELVRDGYELLTDGGYMIIITFHSGEDRIVKNLFRNFDKDNNSKQKPSRKETLENRKSRSAILRMIIKKTII